MPLHEARPSQPAHLCCQLQLLRSTAPSGKTASLCPVGKSSGRGGKGRGRGTGDLLFMPSVVLMPQGMVRFFSRSEKGTHEHRIQANTAVGVQLLSCVWLFATPWTAARQASLSFINSWSLLKLLSIESVMPSNHLILCHSLLLLPSIFPSIRVFSNESVLHIRWPKNWSFSFNLSPSKEYSGLVSFRIWLFWFPCSPRTSQESSPTPQFRSINSSALSLLYGPTLMSIQDYWKNQANIAPSLFMNGFCNKQCRRWDTEYVNYGKTDPHPLHLAFNNALLKFFRKSGGEGVRTGVTHSLAWGLTTNAASSFSTAHHWWTLLNVDRWTGLVP